MVQSVFTHVAANIYAKIYWNKRTRLHNKTVQLPQDWLGTPPWPRSFLFVFFCNTNMAAVTSCKNPLIYCKHKVNGKRSRLPRDYFSHCLQPLSLAVYNIKMSARVFMKFLSENVILLSIWGRISNRLNVSAVCCIPFAQNVMLTITPLLKVLQRSLKVLILLRWQLWLHAEKRSELQVRIDILFSQWLKCLWFNRTVLFQKEKIDWKDVSLRALGIIIYDNHSNEKIMSQRYRR